MTGRHQDKLYRALNPIYEREPLSGRGAELYGGRFNPKGIPALYASLSVMTALREANQAGSLQPTTLVSYDAEVEDVFDTRETAALNAQGMNLAALADGSWRDQMKTAGEATTQTFARRLSLRDTPACSSGAPRPVRPPATSISSCGVGAMPPLPGSS